MSESPFIPSQPYAGGSGWSGSATSRMREIERDASGETRTLQQQLLALVTRAGSRGLTVYEARSFYEGTEHHGGVSGALSNLHAADYIARLKQCRPERGRKKCEIYVLPRHVDGRQTTLHEIDKIRVVHPEDVYLRDQTGRILAQVVEGRKYNRLMTLTLVMDQGLPTEITMLIEDLPLNGWPQVNS